MDFAINSTVIDVFVIFILLIMVIFGYFRGFVYRAYDLAASLASLIIALYASAPLSSLYTIYEAEGIGLLIGDMINRFIIFMILFSCLKLICFLLGLIIKPLLKKIISSFSLFKHCDHLLGAGISVIETIILIYLALIFIVTPIIPGGKENVEETIVAKKILELVPGVTDEIELWSTVNEIVGQGLAYDGLDSKSIYTVSLTLNNAYDHGLLNQTKLEEVLMKYCQDIDQLDQPIKMNQEEYLEVEKLLSKVDQTKFDCQKILNKIIVSE